MIGANFIKQINLVLIIVFVFSIPALSLDICLVIFRSYYVVAASFFDSKKIVENAIWWVQTIGVAHFLLIRKYRCLKQVSYKYRVTR